MCTHTHTHTHIILEASLVAQMVKNLPVMQETQVWSLGQKDHLEKGMATHSSILAWRIPWTEETGGLQSMGSESETNEWLTLSLSLHFHFPIGSVSLESPDQFRSPLDPRLRLQHVFFGLLEESLPGATGNHGDSKCGCSSKLTSSP